LRCANGDKESGRWESGAGHDLLVGQELGAGGRVRGLAARCGAGRRDLSAAIDAAPAGSPAGRQLRGERAALLEQVGVAAAAAYDRESESAE
jgi:hypothetical protein